MLQKLFRDSCVYCTHDQSYTHLPPVRYKLIYPSELDWHNGLLFTSTPLLKVTRHRTQGRRCYFTKHSHVSPTLRAMATPLRSHLTIVGFYQDIGRYALVTYYLALFCVLLCVMRRCHSMAWVNKAHFRIIVVITFSSHFLSFFPSV